MELMVLVPSRRGKTIAKLSVSKSIESISPPFYEQLLLFLDTKSAKIHTDDFTVFLHALKLLVHMLVKSLNGR